VSNPKPKESGGNGSSTPGCQRCYKSHSGKCLAGMDGCIDCGKNGNKVKDCPFQSNKGKDGRQPQPSGSVLTAPHQKK